MSVQMLKRERESGERKVKGSYRTYSIPANTAALVPEFAMKVLPSAELHPRFRACSEGSAFGRNTLMMMNYVR